MAKMKEYVRFGNRKIHARGDATAYVSMADLIATVRSGTVIKVTDDVSGADVTSRVLARLVYDMSRMAEDDAFDAGKLVSLIRGARGFGDVAG